MDRFSKTTEIDTAEIAATMEDNAPKKSKATNVIALILCLLIAIIVWVSVMETDTDFENDYSDIPVYPQLNGEKVGQKNVILKGARKDIVDIKAEDIVLVGDENSGYVAYITNENLQDLVLTNAQVDANGNVVVLVMSK